LINRGFDIVIPCPTALFWDSGATTQACPNSFATSQSAKIPDEYIPSSFVTKIFNSIDL
jgi:hypothetical protein